MRIHLSIFVWTVLALGLCSGQNVVSGSKKPKDEPSPLLLEFFKPKQQQGEKNSEVEDAYERLKKKGVSTVLFTLVILDTPKKRDDARIVLKHHKRTVPLCKEKRAADIAQARDDHLDFIDQSS